MEPREEFSDVLGSSGSRLDRPVARNVPSPPKMTEARNTKIYDCSQPWDGARGYSFENKFEPEFMRGLGKISDSFVTGSRRRCTCRALAPDPFPQQRKPNLLSQSTT